MLKNKSRLLFVNQIVILFIIPMLLSQIASATEGTQVWTYNTYGWIFSSPALDTDGTIYVGSGTSLHAVNSNGTLKWSYDTGVSSSHQPRL